MIRTAKNSDLLLVTKLALSLWPNHQFDDLKEHFEEILKDKNAMVVICLDRDKPIGFAQCQLRFDYVEGTESSPVSYLEGIFVDEAYRHQGIAKKLLQHGEMWAKEKGCSEFASDCELINTDSLQFHLKVGFTESNRIICFNKKL